MTEFLSLVTDIEPTVAETFDDHWIEAPGQLDTNCHIWMRGHRGGYGQLKVGDKVVGAHRFAWARANGQIPHKAQVRHRCGEKLCVNPDHLVLKLTKQQQAFLESDEGQKQIKDMLRGRLEDLQGMRGKDVRAAMSNVELLPEPTAIEMNPEPELEPVGRPQHYRVGSVEFSSLTEAESFVERHGEKDAIEIVPAEHFVPVVESKNDNKPDEQPEELRLVVDAITGELSEASNQAIPAAHRWPLRHPQRESSHYRQGDSDNWDLPAGGDAAGILGG